MSHLPLPPPPTLQPRDSHVPPLATELTKQKLQVVFSVFFLMESFCVMKRNHLPSKLDVLSFWKRFSLKRVFYFQIAHSGNFLNFLENPVISSLSLRNTQNLKFWFQNMLSCRMSMAPWTDSYASSPPWKSTHLWKKSRLKQSITNKAGSFWHRTTRNFETENQENFHVQNCNEIINDNFWCFSLFFWLTHAPVFYLDWFCYFRRPTSRQTTSP
jgi:hypothetical protein